ncbi:hypothetical protein BFJ63_vAg9750 [Fusarium oxysporum f. sp. narcissi]|uniref:Xylanolytic transcriptional activator regulatory domain-containing protein n=3 Tax=Fusarium oxysporum TaxID=5507 RepID=A0A4Q2VM49_FUSOX|nr:hypothetical protein FOZG_00169 [Fusarium oxysporum Fo47]RKK28981.1 hypothetical protein BFJ65_g922 [Fusarium oxysporum f. sp. cepae]RKL29039.1 hypothetical protein BFJ70_g10751 [Fusarium oxysporum]RYC87441.1 hypothetical protein BFJ63_vAg9750 [Fusarium oxysporum f. sp. narcissi]RKK33661.1 hypothetical protein BFJ67_g14133 [Fusarium oxysporum f. sp. cepae]
MRYCIDNGLHRQATNLPPTLDEGRKQIFWTAYMLERSVARTMGRPHSISDRDIDVPLPANIDDEPDTDEAIIAAIAQSNQHPSQITALTPAIRIFRLQQIDSKISHTNPTFHEIVHSAGQVCFLSKRLHDQQTYISFSLLSLHANFVAGLVMVYCFCLDSSIFSPEFSSSVRACSTMLYIISERWPKAVQARKPFDRLITATIESDDETNNGLLRSEDNLHVSRDGFQPGFAADDPGHLEVWNSFESILRDNQIDLGTWMHDSIFNTMGTSQPMD